MQSFFIADESAMFKFAQQFSKLLKPGLVIYLHGNLGSGKTTLVRGILQALGHTGAVKSPTYTLVEPYQLELAMVYHFDLYRLADPEELEYMGIRDYFTAQSISFVEWPEKGQGVLPSADMDCYIEYENRGRRVRLKADNSDLQDKISGLSEG